MTLGRVAVAIALVLGPCSLGTGADYTIQNPADKIRNPADKMYNPATQINNPATNIYSPAAQMDNPNPLSPPTQPLTKIPTAAAEKPVVPPRKPLPTIPKKQYSFKRVREYLTAAKKAFSQDDYLEFLAITEDALRRIDAGTLKASKKSQQKLLKYKTFGYGLLETDE
jgi:hypothetical protein